ncbi:MAG: hypothetical protein JST66_06315 [Bacteroidetes bacterium]|nr:hypothetical protein [Bacteroidota bacterium]
MTFTPVVVQRSRKRGVLTLVFCAVFLALCWWLWNKEPSGSAFHDGEAKAFAPIGGVFFSLLAVQAAVRLFDRRPGLIVDTLGLHDRTTMFGYVHVPWSHLAGIHEVRVKKVRLLAVRLKDPAAFLGRWRGWKRWSFQWNMDHHGSPVIISANTLACSFDELERIVRAGMAAHAAA